MITKEFVLYIQKQLASGRSKDEIRREILTSRKGWSVEDVEEALHGKVPRAHPLLHIFFILTIIGGGVYGYLEKDFIGSLFSTSPKEKVSEGLVTNIVDEPTLASAPQQTVKSAPVPPKPTQGSATVPTTLTKPVETKTPAVTQPQVVAPKATEVVVPPVVTTNEVKKPTNEVVFTPTAPTTPTPTPVVETSQAVVVEDFTSSSNWSFYNGAEFPGAQGSFSVVSGRSGNAGRITFSMQGGAHYVLAQKSISVASEISKLSLWLKAPPAVQIFVRLTDSTGQNLQYMVTRTLESMAGKDVWTYHTVEVSSPVTYWGGSADGRIHYPITSIQLGVEPVRFTLAGVSRHAVNSGTVDFDDITFNSDVFVLDPVSSPTYPLSVADIQSTLGFSIHGPDFTENSYNKLTNLGARYVRTDLIWSEVEKEQGVYSFARYDELVSALNGRGMQVLFILDYGNELYGLPGNTGPHTAEQIARFGEFAKAAAVHFKNSNVMFEVWNEPNLNSFWLPANNPYQYAELSKVAIAKIHEGNPSAKVTTAGLSGFDIEWLAKMIDAGGAEGADAIGWHPYQSFAPEEVMDKLFIMKLIAREKTGRSIPIWNTEWGYSSAWYGNGGTTVGQRVQAKLSVRQILSNLIVGFPFNTYYNLTDDSEDTRASEYNFGLYTRAGEQKLAGRALELLHNNTLGWRVVGLMAVERGDIHVLKLEKGGAFKLIVWQEKNPTQNSSTAPFKLKLSRRPVGVVDFLGTSISYGSEGGLFTVPVSDEPVYIQF